MKLLLVTALAGLVALPSASAQTDRRPSVRDRSEINRAEARRYQQRIDRSGQGTFGSPFAVGQPSRPVPPASSGSTVVPNR